MDRIIHAVDIKAPKDRVYDALTTPQGLGGWWTKEVTADVRIGGRIDFRFGTVFHPVMEVVKLDPGRTVEWKCVGGEKDWENGRFAFHLEDRGALTLLMFTQDYARELSDEVYGRFNFNWGYYLGSLKKLCETGQGFPFSA
jgi:uncharacterized protein YndB with AHSA1/START domain